MAAYVVYCFKEVLPSFCALYFCCIKLARLAVECAVCFEITSSDGCVCDLSVAASVCLAHVFPRDVRIGHICLKERCTKQLNMAFLFGVIISFSVVACCYLVQ